MMRALKVQEDRQGCMGSSKVAEPNSSHSLWQQTQVAKMQAVRASATISDAAERIGVS